MRAPHRTAIALILALLGACKRAPDAAPAAGTTSAAAPLVDAPPGALFPTGVMLRGDRASLQHYLRYVDTVVDAKVHVTYAPATVYVDRDAAINSLHSASWDGVTWKFDAAEPVIQKLKPGSVLLVWGLAIRKVTQVDRVGDEIVVRTEEAQLTDAVTDADISWDAPANMGQGAMAVRVPKPQDAVKFVGASYLAPPSPPSPFRFAAFAPLAEPDSADEDEPDSAATEPPALYQQSYKIQVNKYAAALAFGAPSNDQLNFYAQFAYGDEAEEPVALPNELGPIADNAKKFGKWADGKQKEWEKEAKEGKKKLSDVRDETKMTSGPGPGLRQPIPKNSEEQQQQKEEEDKEAAHQKKYGKPTKYSTTGTPKYPQMPKVPTSFKEAGQSLYAGLTALTSIKVTAAGKVTGLRSQGDIVIKGGTLEHATLSNPEFHLTGDVWWAVRIDKAVFAENTHVEVPITFRVPLILGGLPAFFEIAVNAQIGPRMTSKKAWARGHRHIDFTKSAQLTLTNGDVNGESGDPTADADQGSEEKIGGIGVSGLNIALQMPRVGFGFGIIGSNLMVYFDVIVSSGVAFTGETGIIHCTHSMLVANFNVGVSATFLGFPLGDKRKAGPSKQWDWTDPPGRKCG